VAQPEQSTNVAIATDRVDAGRTASSVSPAPGALALLSIPALGSKFAIETEKWMYCLCLSERVNKE